MSKRLSGINPLAYLGVEPYVPPAMYQNGRSPTVNDSSGYNLGDFWLVVPPGYSGPELLFVLISLNMGQATWVQLYPNSGLSIEFETDAGSVNPVAGVVNVFGDGSNISTSGSGNTITISLDGDVATQYDTDLGTAQPSSNTLHVDGGSNINTSGAFSTLTINLNPNVNIPGTLEVQGAATFDSAVTVSSFSEGVVQSDNSGILSSTKGTNGQILIGSTAGAPAWANITSTGATVTITNNANSINLETAGGGGGNTIVSQFTSSGTWNKNVATQYIEVYGWCGGGGGASGDIVHFPATSAAGGGGGGSYGVFYFYGPAFCFDASVAITVGAGGAGGVGIASGSPNPGGDGGASFFGTISTRAANNSGPLDGSGGGNNSTLATNGISVPGYWGDYSTTGWCVDYLNDRSTTITNSPGFGGISGSFGGKNGLSRSFISKVLSQPGISYEISYGTWIMSGTGGGGAGVAQSGTVASSGGSGGSILNPVSGTGTLVAGGAGGLEGVSIDGGNGGDGVTVSSVNLLCGGAGGGGGGNRATGGSSGDGGNGGFPGGGGGGGGATLTGSSGSGGNGADGLVIVIEYL